MVQLSRSALSESLEVHVICLQQFTCERHNTVGSWLDESGKFCKIRCISRRCLKSVMSIPTPMVHAPPRLMFSSTRGFSKKLEC